MTLEKFFFQSKNWECLFTLTVSSSEKTIVISWGPILWLFVSPDQPEIFQKEKTSVRFEICRSSIEVIETFEIDSCAGKLRFQVHSFLPGQLLKSMSIPQQVYLSSLSKIKYIYSGLILYTGALFYSHSIPSFLLSNISILSQDHASICYNASITLT